MVTNVPGPQFPLYLLGRELQDVFPMVPLAKNQGVCFGIMSYNGQVNFGLTATTTRCPTSTRSPAIWRPRSPSWPRRRPRPRATRLTSRAAARLDSQAKPEQKV